MLQNNKNGMKYEDMPLSKTNKKDVRIISEMSNWAQIRYFAHANRYPLSVITNICLVCYVLNIPHLVNFWYGVFFH